MQEILSCQLFPPFKIPLAKSRITVCHFQPNRSAGPCSAPITRRQIPRLQAPVFLRLAPFPVLFPSLHSRVPLSQLMFALGGPNIQQSALNFSLFVENCRFQMQSLALKKNLQVNTTALISILFTNSYIFGSFSMCTRKTPSEDVWLFQTLHRLDLFGNFGVRAALCPPLPPQIPHQHTPHARAWMLEILPNNANTPLFSFQAQWNIF